MDKTQHNHLPLPLRQNGKKSVQIELPLGAGKARLHIDPRGETILFSPLPPKVNAGVGCYFIEKRSKFTAMGISVQVPHGLEKGLLRGILRRLQIRCMPQAVAEYFRVKCSYQLIQCRGISLLQPLEQRILPRQGVTSP